MVKGSTTSSENRESTGNSPTDTHKYAVILASTGGDRQDHVSLPMEKHHYSKAAYQHQKSKKELETIEENHKEED